MMLSSNKELINTMISSGILKTARIIDAFEKIDRQYFVPDGYLEYVYIDRPLPIGKNQTISQPSTVAFMLELLLPEEGDKVLDIGSGSGWTAALLCAIVGKEGTVLGLERVDDLVEQGKSNIGQFDFKQCQIRRADAKLGVPGRTYDKILVSASAEEIPRELFAQLKIGGALVIPVGNSIFRFNKVSETEVGTEEYQGFVFVPLIYES